jgi:hypothetical protein
MPSEFAGYVFRDGGEQRSIGELGTSLGLAVSRADLTDYEFFVASEFFGLNGFPPRLVGGDSGALVGGVATPSSRLSPTPAGRSTVAALIGTAVAKVATVLEPRPGPSRPIHPELDPASSAWVLAPTCLGRKLSAPEYRLLLESCLVASFDIVCRSEMSAEMYVALHRWGTLHLGINRPMGIESIKLRPERRNAANAAMAVTLWEVTHSENQLVRALRGQPIAGWVGVQRVATGGRILVHPKWGSMTSDLDEDQMLLLVGEVMEGRDDGRAADLLFDAVLAGHHHEVFDADTAETVLWSFGRGLAASGSWRAVEFARWYQANEPVSLTTVSLVAWAAHVASLHRHDGLAWRLCAFAERILDALERVTDEHRAGFRWQVELVRSGCRVREADRWLASDFFGPSAKALEEAQLHLRLAVGASNRFGREPGYSKLITNGLRRTEILIVADRLRRAGRPLRGFRDERIEAHQLVSRMRKLLEQGRAELDGDEIEVLERRLDLISAALSADADVDDSPPLSSHS